MSSLHFDIFGFQNSFWLTSPIEEAHIFFIGMFSYENGVCKNLLLDSFKCVCSGSKY